MAELEFTAEIDEYVVLKLELDAYRASARTLPADFSFIPASEHSRHRRDEERLLRLYFRHWKGPLRGRLKGWREDSRILLAQDGKLVAGIYLVAANEFDDDPRWGQLHYPFTEPVCKGLGIHSVMFARLVERAREWGLQGIYLSTDRHQLPDVWMRWGAVPWKRLAKAPPAPPKPSFWRRLFGRRPAESAS